MSVSINQKEHKMWASAKGNVLLVDIDDKKYWISGIPSRAPELLALRTNKGSKIAPENFLENQTIALPSIEMYKDPSLIISDLFWICGGESLLPSTLRCAKCLG